MARRGLEKVVDTLRRVTATPAPDAELVERYLADRDEVAFELLLQRHEPMVLGVCRRILGHAQDAEDAFQATFLVLVRKAETILPREHVGNWLYGVAQQTARKAWSLRARRTCREVPQATLPEVPVTTVGLDADVAPLLDREISTLPQMYRTVLVLCDLEGRTRREAAEALGWREGTVAGRLARARKLLADRLARRGLMAPALAPFVLPASLIESTLSAACAVAGGAPLAAVAGAGIAALTERVVPMVTTVSLKMAAVVVAAVGLLGVAVGAGYGPTTAPGAPVVQQPRAEPAPVPAQLAAPLRFEFKDTPLRTALDEIRTTTGVNLVLDRQAIQAANVSLDQRISCRVDNLPVLLALDELLTPLRLRAIYADEVVQIKPAEILASRDLAAVLTESKRRELALPDDLVKVYRSVLDVEPKRAGDWNDDAILLARIFQNDRYLAQRAYAEQIAAARRLLTRHQAVQDSLAALDKAIAALRASTNDRQAEIEALDAIIQAAQEMKARAIKKP